MTDIPIITRRLHTGCDHKNFVVSHDVHRLSKVVGGPVEEFRLSVHVLCYDCGYEFRPVSILLVPTGRIARRPQIAASPGMKPAGKGATEH